jgi:hypothetical protein
MNCCTIIFAPDAVVIARRLSAEAIQSIARHLPGWIALSLSLLAMTWRGKNVLQKILSGCEFAV